MTMGYALPLPSQHQPRLDPYRQDSAISYATTAPAQGGEGVKIREFLSRIVSIRTVAFRSIEADQLHIALQRLQLELSQQMLQSYEDLTYEHVPVKPAFSVNATYRFIGRIKPRQFDPDE